MAKLNSEWSEDIFGNEVLKVEKKRGKITIDELEEHLRYSRYLCGNWAVTLRCGETTSEGAGWNDNEHTGDMVLLYEINDKCPICGKEIM